MPRTAGDFREYFRQPGVVALLACRDGEAVGLVWLFRIDEFDRRAEIGYWIAPDEQGNGYGTEALELGVRFAFRGLGLHKVVARVFAFNEGSKRVLEKVGFRKEGDLREHHFVDGEHVDTLLFGLLVRDRL